MRKTNKPEQKEPIDGEMRLKRLELRVEVLETAILAMQENLVKLISIIDEIGNNQIKLRDVIMELASTSASAKQAEQKTDDNGSKGMYF